MRNVYSVAQINRYIKNMFAEDFLLHGVMVRGGVSNCKYHSSGHIYFTLKDASGTLSCIMFAGRRRGLSFRMKEGDQVICQGSVDVYERGGSYQLYVDQITLDGAGLLALEYEKLKRELEESGMFAEEYKQPIPAYIHTLGVVTAPTGAAVRDIIQVSLRRNPYLQIILYPALVQGDGAPTSIIEGIRSLEQYGVDTIIIGRGGGSLEDLWAFNDRNVAEAVFNCAVPIISAVGHETDTVITDYVADRRAPTPSAAAELAVFEYSRFVQALGDIERALTKSMFHKISVEREKVDGRKRELIHLSPMSKIREQRMFTAQTQDRLQKQMEQAILRGRDEADQKDRLDSLMRMKILQMRHTLELSAVQLEQRSPLTKISGGYGYVAGEDGKSILSVEQVKEGDMLSIQLRDGKLFGEVRKIERAQIEQL